MFEWIVLIATIVFWGLAFPTIKYAVVDISPIAIATLRFAIADTLFAVSVVKGKKIEIKDIPSVLLLGLFGVTIYHICLNVGEMYVSSGVASLIVSLSPIFVLIFSWMFLNEMINSWKVSGTIIAFLGVALLSEPSLGNIFGILTILVSTLSAAIYIVLGKKLMMKYDAVTLTSNAMILGSIPLLFFLPTSIWEIYSNFSESLIASLIFLGIFPTYLGYLGWYYFLAKKEASKASIFLLAIPVVSLIAGYFLLDEILTVKTLIGAITIITGIYIVLKG